MKQIIVTYFLIISCALFLCSKAQTKIYSKHKSKFNCSAADRDVLEDERKKRMLCDPATGKIPTNIRMQELAFYNSAIVPFQKNTRAQTWNAVGPYNVGGRTRTVALDITNENIIVAAGVSSGIWRSTNAGQSWTRVSNELGYLGIVSLCQDTRVGYENIWYAVSGELTGNSASGGASYYLGDGFFKSTDSAKTWQVISGTDIGNANSFTQAYQLSWSIASHPAVDSSRLFVATYGGILKSVNAGATWSWTLGAQSNNAYYSDVKITSTGILYAALSSDGITQGFYRSGDSGINWTNITPSALLAGHDRTSIGINPNNENEVYFFSFLLDSNSAGGTITSNYKGAPEYISLLKYTYLQGNGADTNGNWVSLSNNLPNNANVTTGSFDKLNCQGGYDMFVRVQPVTGAVVIGGTNLFISTDAFATNNNWKQFGGYKLGTSLPYFEVWDNHHPDCHDIVFYPSNYKKVLSASDGGVRTSEDINSNSTVVWTSLNNGYLTSQPYTVTLDPAAGNNWLMAGFQDNGNFVTTNYNNAQQAWVMPLNGDGAFNYIAPNNDFVVMSIQQGRIAKFKLDANGNKLNYRRIDPIGPNKDDYGFINPLVVDANDNNYMYVPAGKKVYRQNDLKNIALTNAWDSISQGWFAFSDSIKTANISGRPAQIVSIAISKSNPANMLYIGTDNREIYRMDNVHNTNAAMVNLTKSPLPTGGYLSSISIDPSDAGKVLICYSNYNVYSLFYTMDSGKVWKYCGGNLEKIANFNGSQPSIRCVEIMKGPNGKPKYFCGTSIGLYSTDSLWATSTASKDSTKWIQESVNGIGTSVVNHITHRAADYTVAVSTHGNGCYWGSYAFPAAVIENVATNYNKNAINIYPNPMSTNSNVRLKIQDEQNYNIYVMDLLGRKLRTIAKGQFIKGEHDFSLDGNNLVNGNYLLVMENEMGRKIAKQFIIKK
jgi:hypothetical protein